MVYSRDSLRIAVFFDIENLAIGVREMRYPKFDVRLVLGRLVEKGSVIVRRAYADWSRLSEYERPFHEAGIELIEMPGSKLTGKNSADIKMVVDALEICYAKPHIDAFALVSGDSDFTPLVNKLRENGKHTIGLGVKKSTSHLLVDTCDEFIYYDDLIEKPKRPAVPKLNRMVKKKREAFDQLLDSIEALQRENKELHSSLVKDTMRRKQPQFNEEYHGYSSFNRLLEDAQQEGLIQLRRDERSGTYVVEQAPLD